MTTHTQNAATAPKTQSTTTLRTIDPARYISRDFLEREKRQLWPRVWQIACREEEVRFPGDYVTYDIADESVIVTRTRSNNIVAYHNVCPHRGRRLADGSGTSSQFRCGFHGWTFDLDGCNTEIRDKADWGGCLDGERLDLQHVRVGLWGGFVWIDFRAEGESLKDYLETVPENLDPFEYDKMRFRWYLTIHMPCNWKVALEAFNEGYHVATTHPQLLSFFGDDYTQSYARGKHSVFGYWQSQIPLGMPSPRLNQPWPQDPRPEIMRFFQTYEDTLKAMFSERDYKATLNLMEVVPEGTDAMTTFAIAVELGRKAAEAEGIGYPPNLTWEHMAKAGADWHMFPNAITLPWFDGALVYRARPDGDDPDKCLFDIWSLVRYAPGTEPPLERKVFKDMNGNSAGKILDQDIRNMSLVQRGMKSSAFTKARPNPVQEMSVINFHDTLDRYLDPETKS